MGWRVVNVHYIHWYSLRDDYEREVELRRLVNSVLPEKERIV